MKKIILFSLSIFLLASVLPSCKTHTPCPGVTTHAGKVKTSSTIRFI